MDSYLSGGIATTMEDSCFSEDYEQYLSGATLSHEKQANVVVINVHTESDGGHRHENATASSLEEVQALLSLRRPEPTLRMIFMSQACSWMPLQITQPMLAYLMNRYQIMPEFLQLAAAFCDRSSGVQEGDCYPHQSRHSPFAHEMCYGYRYVELKPSDAEDPWRIRQSALYHRLDLLTGQALILVLSPTPESAFECRAKMALCNPRSRQELVANPLLTHYILLSEHMKSMRGYLKYIEEDLEKIWGQAITSYIDEPMTVTHSNLSRVRFLESLLHPVLPLLTNAESLLNGIATWTQGARQHLQLTDHMHRMLETRKTNLERQTSSHRQNVLFILDRARTTTYTIADLLTFQHQRATQGQSKQMAAMANSNMDDSVNVRVITLVTLFYLPFSFIATVLGMNLFNFNSESGLLEVSNQFWVYFCAAVPLTVVTISFWRWKAWAHHRYRKARIKREGWDDKHCEV